MQRDNHIDSHLKQREAQQLPDLSQMDNHWRQMQTLLAPGTPVPPKKRTWKRITRKTITWMGLVAVVVTTTYYAVETSGRKKVARKSSATQVNKRPAAPKTEPVAKPVLAGTRPSAVKRMSHNTATIIRQETDTVFLQKPELPVKKQAEPEAAQGFYDKIKKPEQQFLIDPTRDTTLIGKEGTTIRIRANSFVYPDRSKVITPLRFTLTECYQYADMLAHCLHTRSGDKQLVSGGMIRLQARDAGNRGVELLRYKPIGIDMPAEKYDPQMQLFVPSNPVMDRTAGNETRGDTIAVQPGSPVADWKPAGQSQGYTANMPAFKLRSKIKLMDVRQQVTKDNNNTEKVYEVKPAINIPEESMKDQLALRYNTSTKDIKLKQVDTFARSANAKNTNVAFTSIGMYARDSVMIYYDAAVKNGWVSKKDSLAYITQVRIDSIAWAEQRKADSIAWVRQRELDRKYTFDVTGLGWINCDKFLRGSSAEVDFTIRIGSGMERAAHKYNLIFTNMKSIMTGKYQDGEIRFGVLPKDEPVKLICVAEKDGKAYACVRSFRVSAGITASLQFEETDPATFRQLVEKR
ncbi:MAG: hypothetical protein U0T79_08700 [Ferruginibacter sp.]